MERLGIGSTRKFENGFSISVRAADAPMVEPGDVAKHEAVHVVAADGEIISATNIPSGDSKGATVVKKMTAIAAAGPAAMGHAGYGYDEFLVERVLGEDFKKAMAGARAKLRGKEDEVFEVASLIEERRTIGQSDVKEARENVRRKRRGIRAVKVQIFSPQGNVRSFSTESFKGEVSIADFVKTLPKAA